MASGSAQPATPPAQAPTLHGNVGAYSQRERHAQSMEDDGTISFQYIQNDGDPNNTMRYCCRLIEVQFSAA